MPIDDIAACAEIVQRGDPDRFLATMAAPVAARTRLFPLYAFNVEIARAPWLTQEPMIAEMRLQWWRDALENIAKGRANPRHEVLSPLADVVSPDQAVLLDDLVAARRWDIHKQPFENTDDFEGYIDRTSGNLLLVAARSLGSASEEVVRDLAYATGLANWFSAVPSLIESGRAPLVEATPEAVAGLAEAGLQRLGRARRARASISHAAAPALWSGWQAGVILTQVVRRPERVFDSSLGTSGSRRRLSLMRVALTGRW